ncbi:protein kinase domain containing protein [Acanthamoeba castellanii str. Neff]|jgi:LIM domain kinase 1|uniref:non-specific serine/threonine protein kinase n=1 Tax=Acanthamoeba castellanii (strain ATCC 30010 / Neff) TaxID=1257118 RepID=L8GX52_ACACF|nr:protein kinase domain containing protein [Acanthamoeba castellanii str. Neff]ELR17849.1 protein kinase domain containing protein [Acanthamoeba castellanii str. Neff]
MADDGWNIQFSDLQTLKTIGKGNFGKVFKGVYVGTEVAIKQLYYVDDEDMQKYIEREMATLKGLRHPNIVQLLGLCKDDTGIYIVTEFIPGGDLRSKLKDDSLELSWLLRVKIAIDVAYAMNYLHSKKMIHRDLKSQNLLVCEDWKIKVCDFGFARKAEPKADFLTMCGTDEWMAPEVGLGEKYDTRADVFSYGMVLCELVTRRKPPRRQAGRAYAFEVKELKTRAPPDTPPELMDLIVNCAQFYPEKRPTFRDILQDLKELSAKLERENPSPPPLPPVVSRSANSDDSSDSSDSSDSDDDDSSDDDSSEESSEEFESSAAGDEELSYGGIVEED